jgi:carbamoyl-phosphate synthase large subunit
LIPTLTILLTSAGRRVQLSRCLQEGARSAGVRLRLLAADLQPELSAACWESDQAFRLPPCASPEYAEAVAEIVRTNGVALIIPTIDPELLPLANAADRLRLAGARLVAVDAAGVRLARDKLATAKALSAAGLETPETLPANEVDEHISKFPNGIVVKPRSGSSSVGVHFFSHVRQVPAELRTEANIIQDLVVGREFTVNCYIDRSSQLAAAVPHERLRVRAGEVEKAVTRAIPEAAYAAKVITTKLGGTSAVFCFQGVLGDDGRFVIIEINARFGGGYPVAHRAGAPFTKWLVEDALGRPSTISDAWRPGLLMLRYDDAVFFEAPDR